MEKEPRVKFVAFYPDDFYEDDRVATLTTREQQQWLMLLTKMIRFKGEIPDRADLISQLVGISRNEGIKFRTQLVELRLLVIDDGKLVSNRLKAEYLKALKSYKQKSIAGMKSAEARAQVIDFPNSRLNDRCNDRSNDDPTE